MTADDEAALGALRPEWEALWRRDGRATPFGSPAWCVPWWEHLGGGDLRLLEARRGGQLIGLVAGFLWEGRVHPLGVSHGDYGDALIDPDHAAEAWEGLATAGEAFAFPDAREGVGADAWAAVGAAGGGREACPVLAADAGGLWAAVPAKTRRDVRQARARAAALGARMEGATPGTIPAMLDALARFGGERWEDGVLGDPRVRAFHHAAAAELMEQGSLRMHALVLGERVLAVYYGMEDAHRAYAYLGGFDAGFERQSFGAVTLAHALDSANAAGAREFHFLRGREAYKYAWGAVDRVSARLRLDPA